MIAWLILVLFTAALNLFVFIAARGRWGRLVPLLAIASLAGTVAGSPLRTPVPGPSSVKVFVIWGMEA